MNELTIVFNGQEYTLKYNEQTGYYEKELTVPDIGGDINKVNLDTLDFPKPITTEEWKQLPKEYRTAWLKGNMTKELSEYGLNILQQIRERKMEVTV